VGDRPRSLAVLDLRLDPLQHRAHVVTSNKVRVEPGSARIGLPETIHKKPTSCAPMPAIFDLLLSPLPSLSRAASLRHRAATPVAGAQEPTLDAEAVYPRAAELNAEGIRADECRHWSFALGRGELPILTLSDPETNRDSLRTRDLRRDS